MDRLETTPSAMRASAEALTKAATEIWDVLEKMQDDADALRLAWEGDAQVAFDRKQTLARAKLDAHRTRLIQIAEAVTELSNVYGRVDRAAARALGGQ
ncbi:MULTISPECIES: WXG100 family type VII secretion target [unclassified Leucobacter]|uniref:WXG100 family type VII secretion target n=1 Tax=unclassified Leucobacter TaxID=2621730 RepID=UPI00165E1A09|nr:MULTISPECIES: WXG100 family type VII secretion target [unclassified Leucobacter]MBC9927490.1 WXG100 family type VII secretion target [Leucobacter sp. cx-169]